MKYVMLEVVKGGVVKHYPVIFPDAICHDTVFNALHDALIIHENAKDVKAFSAGSISSMGINSDATGSSETLDIASDIMDAAKIKLVDYSHGATDTHELLAVATAIAKAVRKD